MTQEPVRRSSPKEKIVAVFGEAVETELVTLERVYNQK